MTRNIDRSEATRTALLDAAHTLFAEHGFAATSTPQVCAAAGITRGALYHHFADKADLFRAVLAREAESVQAEVEGAAPAGAGNREQLLRGSDAYLQAMTRRGRTRLLLVEAPAVLGADEVAALDEANAGESLRQGLTAALPRRDAAFVRALAALLGAAFDRAARDIDAGADAAATRKAMRWLIERVVAG
jgi:AcrR family transcriptional regulator